MAYIWNAKTGDFIHKLEGHKDSVTNIAYNHDGKLIATGKPFE